MRVQVYDESMKGLWDEFVNRSRNSTFMHRRDFIEYHGDRFQDCSLMVCADDNRPTALLPANREGQVLVSHAGLTYGGFITDDSTKQPQMLDIFDSVLTWLQQAGVNKLVYKTTPHIHHRIPAEEDLYALYLAGGKLIARDVWPVIPRELRPEFQERRGRGVSKAAKAGLEVRESDDLSTYWTLLTAVLAKHSAAPVHSLQEITKLKGLFPGHIRLFGVFDQNKMLGGVLIFETDRVARAQYIAALEEARSTGGLDLLFHHLLNTTYRDTPYFDFGTTTTQGGAQFNRFLSDQKEGFGARSIVHDRYEIDLSGWVAGSLSRYIQ